MPYLHILWIGGLHFCISAKPISWVWGLSKETKKVYIIWGHLSSEFSEIYLSLQKTFTCIINVCEMYKGERQLQKSPSTDENWLYLLVKSESTQGIWHYFKIQIIILTMDPEFIQQNKCNHKSQGQVLYGSCCGPHFPPHPTTFILRARRRNNIATILLQTLSTPHW